MIGILVEAALKSLPLAAFAFAMLWLMKRKSASAKFTVLSAIFATLAILPIAIVVSPKVAVIEKQAPVLKDTTIAAAPSSNIVLISPLVNPEAAIQATKPLLSAEEGVLLVWLLGVIACWSSLLKDILTGLRSLPSPAQSGSSISWAKEDGLGPFVWGWLKPRVVLPKTVHDWDQSLRSALIAHEFAHVRRGDWPLRIAFRLIRGLYWFNPLIWLLEKRAAIESELACDDLVVTAGADPAQYAEGLLEVAKMQRLSTAPGAGSPRLKTRLVALFDKTRDRSEAGKSIKLAALATVMVVIGALAPLSIGSEAPAKATVPNFLERPAQSRLDQRPAKAPAQGTAKYESTTNKSESRGVSAAKFAQGTSTFNKPQGQASLNRAGSPRQGGTGVYGASGQGGTGVYGSSGHGGTTVSAKGTAPQVSGSSAPFTVTKAEGQGAGAGAAGSGGTRGQAPPGKVQSGGGFGGTATTRSSAPVGGASGRGSSVGAKGSAQGGAHGGSTSAGSSNGASASGGEGHGSGGTYVTARGVAGLPVSGDGAVAQSLGTKVEDLGNGIYKVTHNTDLGSFTAQGHNIELYRNGVLVLNEPVPAGREAVRHMKGFITSAMKGRGSMAYASPDAP